GTQERALAGHLVVPERRVRLLVAFPDAEVLGNGTGSVAAEMQPDCPIQLGLGIGRVQGVADREHDPLVARRDRARKNSCDRQRPSHEQRRLHVALRCVPKSLSDSLEDQRCIDRRRTSLRYFPPTVTTRPVSATRAEWLPARHMYCVELLVAFFR